MSKPKAKNTGGTDRVKSDDPINTRSHGWQDAYADYDPDKTWGGDLNIGWIDADGNAQVTPLGSRPRKL